MICLKKAILGVLFFIVVIGVLFFFKKKYDNTYFQIETYRSNVDQDRDGIDDQTDILEGVRAYINTKPKYKSKYYETGYPNDNYGVCTDVVAFGLLNAGYDLMELVNADILKNQNQYNIENIDKKIDFRRVQNLNIFFKNHNISLTTNIYEIEQWQGGDIVFLPLILELFRIKEIVKEFHW